MIVGPYWKFAVESKDTKGKITDLRFENIGICLFAAFRPGK